MTTVYTIGYAGRKISVFLNILKEYNVEVVVDVRRFPKSKDPIFKRENLEDVLMKNGMRYVFMGESLGGFRKNGYERYMKTQEFMDGFRFLLGLAKEETIAIMCKEKDVKYCHRRFISRLLEDFNISVIHI